MLRILGTLLLAFAACSSPSPTPDAGPPPVDARPDTVGDLTVDQGTDAGPCTLVKPYSSKDPVCNTCAEERCCPEVNACLSDPACDDSYVNCILACTLTPIPDAGVSACLQQCAADHPKGKAEYDVAIGCAETRCATECQ